MNGMFNCLYNKRPNKSQVSRQINRTSKEPLSCSHCKNNSIRSKRFILSDATHNFSKSIVHSKIQRLKLERVKLEFIT